MLKNWAGKGVRRVIIGLGVSVITGLFEGSC